MLEISASCQKLDENRYVIAGRELSLPMDIADLSLLAQVFTVRTRDARELLEGTALRPAELWPGTSALALMAVRYRDNPLGDYNEAIVSVPAYAPDEHARPLLGGLDILTRRASHYVYAMPVDQDFTLQAGRFLWGYPKVLANIDITLEDATARAALSQDGEPVFSLEVPMCAPDARSAFKQSARNLTLQDGVLRRITATFEGEGVAFRLGGRAPTIGETHPLALRLRALGLPKRPLASASLRRARARFGLAEVLAQTR